MTVSLTSNFLTKARGLIFEDSATVTWSLDPNTNELTATASGSGGGSGANPTAKVGLTAVNGSATTFLRSDGAPPIDQAIIPTWTGLHTFTGGVTISGTLTIDTYTLSLTGNASLSGTNTGDQVVPTAANPSGTIGLTAVNGSASSFMRSDGAPALGVGISPTWTGAHTFTPGSGTTTFNGVSGNYTVTIKGNSSAGNSEGLIVEAGTGTGDFNSKWTNQAGSTNFMILYGDGGLVLGAATSGDEGLGTINVASGYYVNGVLATGIGAGTSVTILAQAGGASQNYSVPASAKYVRAIPIGGGGGGGGGAKNTTTGTAAGGGGGGASGGITIVDFLAADLPATIKVVFSNTSGGAGGAGATVSGSGRNGTAGSNVSLETSGGVLLAYAGGGNPGNAGTSGGAGTGGTNGGSQGTLFGGLGGASGGAGGGGSNAAALAGLTTGFSSLPAGQLGPTGGGGGGGANAAAGTIGGTGGSSAASLPLLTCTGGIAGTAGSGSADGGIGGTGTGYSSLCQPGGGGGGSASGAHNGGKGGPGAGYGAGGGGGGGCYDSSGGNGGTGGAGGAAVCILIAW